MSIFNNLSKEALNIGHQFKLLNSTLLISPDINVFQRNNPFFLNLVSRRNIRSKLIFNPSTLSGQFLIIDIPQINEIRNTIYLISDCFCSIPCYYDLKGNLSLEPIESIEFDQFSLIDYLLTRRISAGFTVTFSPRSYFISKFN